MSKKKPKQATPEQERELQELEAMSGVPLHRYSALTFRRKFRARDGKKHPRKPVTGG